MAEIDTFSRIGGWESPGPLRGRHNRRDLHEKTIDLSRPQSLQGSHVKRLAKTSEAEKPSTDSLGCRRGLPVFLRILLILAKIHLFTSTQGIGTGLLRRQLNVQLRRKNSPLLRFQ